MTGGMATGTCLLRMMRLAAKLGFHPGRIVRKKLRLLFEGSLNSKLPTIWTVEKQSRLVKSAERRRNSRNSAKVRRKKIHPRQMLEKSRNAVFFQ